MGKISLCRDLRNNPRNSECSRVVVSKWGDQVDVYLPETPDASNTHYFNLTAERFLYRNKILSLPIDQTLSECDALQSAHPFGVNGPTFSNLRNASVRMAMAFVPLALNGGNDRAVLARLYCVVGLSPIYRPQFAEGLDSPGIARYSWFVAGVPSVFEGESISGRSWLLAANLLMKAVEKNDKATARNLVGNFIVTGDVENGSIKEVEMGNKPNLANIKEYRNFKWIIPMKNENEMNNISSRKVEKPETLEEAYELIEMMRSRATSSFFRFLKDFNFEGMREQFDIGADIFAEDAETSLLPIEYITTAIDLALNSKDGENGKKIYPKTIRPIKMPC